MLWKNFDYINHIPTGLYNCVGGWSLVADINSIILCNENTHGLTFSTCISIMLEWPPMYSGPSSISRSNSVSVPVLVSSEEEPLMVTCSVSLPLPMLLNVTLCHAFAAKSTSTSIYITGVHVMGDRVGRHHIYLLCLCSIAESQQQSCTIHSQCEVDLV